MFIEVFLKVIRHSTILKCKTNTEKERYLEVTNKLWRHLDYKNFISWINYWTFIDRFNRIVIPACVLHKFGNAFQKRMKILVSKSTKKMNNHKYINIIILGAPKFAEQLNEAMSIHVRK
jgi:hypothetical protein